MEEWLAEHGLEKYYAKSIEEEYDDPKIIRFMEKESIIEWASLVNMKGGAKAKLLVAWYKETQKNINLDREFFEEEKTSDKEEEKKQNYDMDLSSLVEKVDKIAPKSTKLPGSEELYHVFLSHRQASDQALALSFFSGVKARSTDYQFGEQGTKPRPFLDIKSLCDGESWQEGFIRGLFTSVIVTPILSWTEDNTGSVAGISKLHPETGEDWQDNVLLELELALVLQQSEQSVLRSIFPILHGGSDSRGFLPFPFNKLEQLSQWPSLKTKAVLVELCTQLGIPLSPDIIHRGVRQIVQLVLQNQGIKLSDLGVPLVATDAAVNRIFNKSSEELMKYAVSKKVSKTTTILITGGGKKGTLLLDLACRKGTIIPDSKFIERGGCAGVTFKGMLYVVGGFKGRHLRTVQFYNPLSKEWMTAPDMLRPREFCVLENLAGKVYAIGGKPLEISGNSIEQFDGIKWQLLDLKLDHGYEGQAGAVFQDSIYLAGGGQDGRKPVNTVWRFDGKALTKVKSCILPRWRAVLAVFKGRLFLMGGTTGSAMVEQTSVESFDGKNWVKEPDMLYADCGFGAFVYEGKLYVFGKKVQIFDGSSWSDITEEFNTSDLRSNGAYTQLE
eukprot:Lithocolla_globosa_v1_NODE_1980_length_2229_cov_24.969181.p1 type:complete len:613 gc:universal NODE_1980_length_2229_cov_24.969181:122-1960(+)